MGKRGSLTTRSIGTGLALYMVCIAVTAAGNVPLNRQLANYTSIDASSAAEAREEFEADWNRLNLIRTLAVTASFASLVVAASTTSRPSSTLPSKERMQLQGKGDSR